MNKMYSDGRVLIGFWIDKLVLDLEKREKLERIKAAGQLPCQRQEHLIGNFVQPRPLPSLQDPPVVKYGEGVLLHAPEIVDLSYLFENNRGCLDEPKPWGPRQYGLVVAATASVLDVKNGVEGIKDGCPVACSPERRPMLRNVFTIRSANAVPSDGEVVGLGQEFFLEIKLEHETLYLRSETPLVDGIYGPFYHNPVRLNQTRDAYAKWRALHWLENKRFETEGAPILPCMRIVIQHVMTGQFLAAEYLLWHRSLLGFECGLSVHKYVDKHHNVTSECIWNIVCDSKILVDAERSTKEECSV